MLLFCRNPIFMLKIFFFSALVDKKVVKQKINKVPDFNNHDFIFGFSIHSYCEPKKNLFMQNKKRKKII